MRIDNITYHVTDDEGDDHEVTVSFSREYSWQQWGAVTDVLWETMKLSEMIQDAAATSDDLAALLWERERGHETVTDTCQHCGRGIAYVEGDGWVDPEAPMDSDDSIWREACDEHDSFVADHEPNTNTNYAREETTNV